MRLLKRYIFTLFCLKQKRITGFEAPKRHPPSQSLFPLCVDPMTNIQRKQVGIIVLEQNGPSCIPWDTNVQSDNYFQKEKFWGQVILSKFGYYSYLKINNLYLPIRCSEKPYSRKTI